MLEAFSAAEQAVLPERIERAARAVEAALRHGVAAAMNEFNRDPDAESALAMSDVAAPRASSTCSRSSRSRCCSASRQR